MFFNNIKKTSLPFLYVNCCEFNPWEAIYGVSAMCNNNRYDSYRTCDMPLHGLYTTIRDKCANDLNKRVF